MKRLLTTAKVKTMVHLLALCAMVIFALPANTYAATIPPEVLEAIKANYPNGLPRYTTPEEQQWLDQQAAIEALEAPMEVVPLAAPPGVVWTPGEYELLQGVIVAWEAYTPLLTSFVVEVSQSDTNAKVYVVVDTTTERTSVTTTLTNAGANMSNVAFIVRTTDTVWIRDYGPRYFLENSAPAIMDHKYNRPRPNDDAFPPACAASSVPFPQNEPVYWLGGTSDADALTHGGGNFHCVSTGDAFMSTLILNENPGKTEAQIRDIVESHFNVNLTIYPRLISNVDATGHIDMWFMPLSDNKVLISQFPSSGYPLSKATTDNAAANLQARGYTVYRTPAYNSTGEGSSGGTHYTYTNAAIVNNKVFIPWYNNATNDAAALATFTSAMPGYEIIQIDCRDIIPAAGAIHCVMKHVYAPSGVEPPGKATNPSPANGATGVGVTTDLSWTADSNATSHDVYFGTTNPPPYQTNQMATTYDTGTMSSGTIYYWRIDERNAGGATTGDVWSFTTVFDTTPPTPNPMTWATVPAATGPTSITMTATTATDATSPPVQYYFECTTDGSKSSSWQTSTTYMATGLTPSTLYSFRVKARDSAPTQNETGWSSEESATTPVQPPMTVYDFSSGAGTKHYAWGTYTDDWNSDLQNQRRKTPEVGTQVTSVMADAYTRLASSDNSRYTNPDEGSGDESTFIAEFNVDENPDDVVQLDVLWEGYGNASHHMELYVWDYVQGNWGNGQGSYGNNNFMDDGSGTSDFVLSGSITQNPSRYIDSATGQITVLVYDDTSSEASYHDYISVTVYSTTAPPTKATSPSPGDGAINVSLTPTLSWTAGSGATSHLVYFGTDSTPDSSELIGNQPVPDVNYAPGTLNANTTYYWRIDANSTGGTTTGDVWSFTTNALVPNVVNMTQAAATTAITDAGLVVGNVTYECSNTVAAGLVISQTPVGNTQVDVGSSVDLVVSTGMPSVPNVVGSTEAAAIAAINAVANISYGSSTTECSDTVPAGSVISQSATGTVPCGTIVNLVVSSGPCLKIISGYVNNECNEPIEGVLVDANNGGGEDTTDDNGFYEVEVDYNWSGTVTPSKQLYTFEPDLMSYVNVIADQPDQNYVAYNIYDLDCDGFIGFGDVAVISENWLETGEDIPGDLYEDEDNTVNFLDFADFANVW